MVSYTLTFHSLRSCTFTHPFLSFTLVSCFFNPFFFSISSPFSYVLLTLSLFLPIPHFSSLALAVWVTAHCIESVLSFEKRKCKLKRSRKEMEGRMKGAHGRERKERKQEGRRNQGMFSASANNLLLSLKHLCCCF